MKKIFVWLALLMVVALVVSLFGSVGGNKTDKGESGGSGGNTGSWKLTDLTDSVSEYNMRIVDGCLLVDGEPWAVFDNDDNFIADLYPGNPVDLSSLDTGKSYYVNGTGGDSPRPGNAAARLVYEVGGESGGNTGGGSAEKWLFENKYLDADYSTDNLPAPEEGVSYTVFNVAGILPIEIATGTAEYVEGPNCIVLVLLNDGDEGVKYIDGVWWSVGIESTFSVRING